MQTAQYYDRFGNAYTEEELMPPYHPLALRGNCDSGHFAVYFEGADWTTDEQATICQVFANLSELILSENHLPVDILLRKMKLQAGIAGTGTPFWEGECGMANSLILDRLNNALLTSYPVGNFLSEIRISTAYDWHTLADDLPTDDFANPTIAAGYLDLYSITLHEALHTLGFASRISLNGTPLPDGNFYSRWDRFIFSVPQNDYLLQHAPTPDCCSEYIFNNSDFPDMPDDIAFGCTLELAFKNAAGQIIAPVNVGAYTTFTGDNGAAFFLNKLSHLDFACATNLGLSPALKYVMHPGFNYTEARRIVTVEEQQILCALGYHLITEEYCQQPCEVFTNPDNYQLFLTGSAINNPLTFALSDANSIFANDIIPEDATLTIDTDCGFIGSLGVSFNGTAVTLTATATGIFSFCYTVTSCEGICQTETVTVNVNNEPVETQCNDPYCNIVCFGDFEGFQLPMSTSEYYDQLLIPEIQYVESPSTPSVVNYDGNNILNPNIGLGYDWDAIPIPLSQPIPVDCEVQISFNATAIHMYWPGDDPTLQPTLQFTALSDYPCSSFDFPNCTPNEFVLCSGATAANMTPDPCGLPIDFQAVPLSALTATIDAIDFNNLPYYTFSWTNTTDQPITTLLLNANVSIGDISNAGAVMTFLDNLIVTLECEEHISIASSDIQEVCPGSTVSIPYTICLENPQSTMLAPVSVFLDANVELPGISVVTGGFFNAAGQANVVFDPNVNLCTTIALTLHIGASFVAGQEINIGIQAFNAGAGDYCVSGNSNGINTILTIIDCGDPPPPPTTASI